MPSIWIHIQFDNRFITSSVEKLNKHKKIIFLGRLEGEGGESNEKRSLER